MATKTAKDLVAEASRDIETLSGEEAVKLVGNPNVVFVDVREGEELQKTGKLQGALHVPRGFLEFQADPASPTHKPELGGGKKLVLYCGSGQPLRARGEGPQRDGHHERGARGRRLPSASAGRRSS